MSHDRLQNEHEQTGDGEDGIASRSALEENLLRRVKRRALASKHVGPVARRVLSIAESRVEMRSDLDEVVRRLNLAAKSWAGERVDEDMPVFVHNADATEIPLIWCFNTALEPPALAPRLAPSRKLIAIRSMADVLQTGQAKAFFRANLIERYAAALLRVQPSGPVFVGGNCQSGSLALELADHLTEKGLHVAHVALLEHQPKAAVAHPLSLIFGRESFKNEFVGERPPDTAWTRDHPDVNWGLVPGEHGTYFSEPNVTPFAKHLNEILVGATASFPTE